MSLPRPDRMKIEALRGVLLIVALVLMEMARRFA